MRLGARRGRTREIRSYWPVLDDRGRPTRESAPTINRVLLLRPVRQLALIGNAPAPLPAQAASSAFRR